MSDAAPSKPSPSKRLTTIGAALIAGSILLSIINVIDGDVSTAMVIFGIVIGLAGMARLSRERKQS
jgi:phosphate/sulfate permease